MAVRLQLDSGEVKEYRTWHEQVVHTDPPAMVSYFTKCGLKWNLNERPSFNEGCDHLDCAIYAATDGPNEDRKAEAMLILFIGAAFFIYGLFWDKDSDEFFYHVGLFFFLVGVFVYLLVYLFSLRDNKKGRELKEFRDHRTINGVKAEQI